MVKLRCITGVSHHIFFAIRRANLYRLPANYIANPQNGIIIHC
jgi:hypothetical protein